MSIQDAIDQLATAPGPSRSLDISIGKAIGLKLIPKSKERPAHWVSPSGEDTKLPRYTYSIDVAYRLSLKAGPKGGVTWDGLTGAARIGRSDSCVAATAAIALCIAALKALSEAENEDKRPSDV